LAGTPPTGIINASTASQRACVTQDRSADVFTSRSPVKETELLQNLWFGLPRETAENVIWDEKPERENLEQDR
jgi:hypothetical protein